MAALKCLACGQDNKAGEEWCKSCSSTLNLKLCSACEAVNGTAAERCHNCGSTFREKLVRTPAPAQAPVRVIEEAPATKSLPAIRRRNADVTTRPRRGRAALYGTLAVLIAAGGAYTYYGLPGVQAANGFIASMPGVEAAKGFIASLPGVVQAAKGFVASAIFPEPAPPPKSARAHKSAHAPKSVPARKSAPVAKSASNSGFIRPGEAQPVTPTGPKVGKAPAPQTKPPAEPKRAAASAPAVAPAAAPPARVTHTRVPEASEAGAASAPASALAVSQPDNEQTKKPPADCPPGVAALGLCISK